MAKINPINPYLMQKFFEYNEGVLYWRVRTNSRIKIGSVAGSLSGNGYLLVELNSKKYFVHRIIYAMHHNLDPAELHVDHINGDGTDNRIENLRLANHEQNCQHRVKLGSRNTSGHRGVSWENKYNKWRVQTMCNGKKFHGGYFSNKVKAIEKALAMRAELFGNFKGK